MQAKAELLIDRRDPVGVDAFVELVLWRLPQPATGSGHGYKYRLAYVVNGQCVLRYDNEAGKGDHKHVGGVQMPTVFTDVDRLLADFMADMARYNDENRHS